MVEAWQNSNTAFKRTNSDYRVSTFCQVMVKH